MGANNSLSTPSLSYLGIQGSKVNYQLTSEALQEIVITQGQGIETPSGALAIETGEFTGRSPLDRFIVKDAITQDKVWWGSINIPFESQDFDKLYDRVISYLDKKDIYVRDCFACAEPSCQMKLRVVNEHAWSNMFAYNMFIRPEESQLNDFEPEWTVINAPGFMASADRDGTRQHNFAILNFTRKIALIGGTGYTGEIKKGIFSALNFILPVYKNTLPMHCSANVDDHGETAIFFGLSGTGKTTLSTDPKRT
jgi:phosphoenolpyruvate carboxykinase (ATP)